MYVQCKKVTEEDLKRAKPYNWNITMGSDNEPFRIYRIAGCYHTIGGRYGNNDLYVCKRDEELTMDNIRGFNGDFAWSYIIEQRNYWRKGEMCSGGYCKILFAGEQVYELYGAISYLSHKAITTIEELKDHPMGINMIGYEEKEIEGRKVWFKDKPGIITRYIKRQGSVLIVPDKGVVDFGRRPDESDEEYEYSFEGDIKEDILARTINWFRD